MLGGLSASSPPSYISSSSIYTSSSFQWSSKVVSVIPRTSGIVEVKPRFIFRCNSSTGSGGPSSPGENENKTVLDAFFLGKALAETLNERIESTVGEFFSTIGRLQAEQQKQVQDLQEEVLERAKRSKEKVAREAMEVQGRIPKSSATEVSADAPTTVPSANDAQTTITTDEEQTPKGTSPVPVVPTDS